MASQNPWKMALIGATTKDSVASGEGTANSNMNSISFNGLEGSTNSLQLNIHRLNGKKLHGMVTNSSFDLGRQGEAWISDRRSDKTCKWRFGFQELEIRKFFDYCVVVNSMEPVIGKPFMFLPTTKDVWEVVRDTYSDLENSSQIFGLKSKLWKAK